MQKFPLAPYTFSYQIPGMHRWLPAFLLLALLGGFRLLGAAFSHSLPNFQPLPAFILCTVIFLRGPMRWWLPLGAWIATDPFASLLQHQPLFGWHHLAILFGMAATAGIAFSVRRRTTLFAALGASLIAAAAFYFLSNTVSFIADPLYSKTITGFWQAQWTGPVGFPPTWIFLRNLALANMVFTALFLLALEPFGIAARLRTHSLASFPPDR